MFSRFMVFWCVVVLALMSSCLTIKENPSPRPAISFDFKPVSSSNKIIVFVHGIFGDPTSTWTNRSGVSWQNIMRGDKTFERFTIVHIRYDTPFLARTSTIEEIAIRVLRQLEDEGVFNYDEIYFVAHSMGGLVTKRMLVALNRLPEIEKLRQVKAVLFISTPAQGANLADLGSWLSFNPQAGDMRPADLNSFLQTLENQWQDLMRDRRLPAFPQVFCAYETKPTYGVLVVPRVYASTMCDQNPFPIDENHIDIVKPANTEADIYKWARSRIVEASSRAEQPRLQYFLTRAPYEYKRGLIVDGVEWQETYGEYEFFVRNPSNNETINDLRLRFDLPWTIVKSQISSQVGCDGLTVSNGNQNTFKIGNEQVVSRIVPFRTNVLEINVLRMFSNASFRGKVILNRGGIKTEHSAVTRTYRYGGSSTPTTESHMIAVLDDGVSVRINSEVLKGEQTFGILLEPENPIQFPPPQAQQLQIAIPQYSVGIIYDASSTVTPIGTGFLLDGPQYVITARDVAYDRNGNLRRALFFHPIGGEGLTPAIPIELYRSLSGTEVVIMKLGSASVVQDVLIRGSSDKLDSGDMVAYGGLALSKDKPNFAVNAHRIQRISFLRGVRTFEVRGAAKAGFVGGPVLGGANTVVGIITKVTPLDDNNSIFYATDVALIPRIAELK